MSSFAMLPGCALVESNSVTNADVVVCDAPGLLPMEIVWECVSTGAIVCNHAAFLGASYAGTKPRTHCVYHAAITTGGSSGPGAVNKRRVWLSDAFVDDHPALCRSLGAFQMSYAALRACTTCLTETPAHALIT